VHTHTHTHTQTHLTALCPGLPGWASTRKVKPIWILLKHETVSGSGISLAICKSAPRSRQITTPAPHHSVFLQAGCRSCRPTNSVKALKAKMCTRTMHEISQHYYSLTGQGVWPRCLTEYPSLPTARLSPSKGICALLQSTVIGRQNVHVIINSLTKHVSLISQ